MDNDKLIEFLKELKALIRKYEMVPGMRLEMGKLLKFFAQQLGSE